MFLNTLRYSVIAAAVLFSVATAQSDSLPVANHSFEIPPIDPIENPYMAIPMVPYWTELDTDTDPLYGGRNTGIFLNPEPNSIYHDHIVNPDGNQLAFLSSGTGNALLQDLSAAYQVGKKYRLQVDVCPSKRYPPSGDPNNFLSLEFYYLDPEENPIIIQTASVPSTELTMNFLKTFSVTLPTIQTEKPWINQNIGIALRAIGSEGMYWDLDNVRVTAYPKIPELTGDALINLHDFAILASQLYTCGPAVADLTGDDCVTTEDIWILADHWLEDLSTP